MQLKINSRFLKFPLNQNNNAPLSYQSLDEDGCFLDVNPTWLKTLGYEREDVIGKCFGDFLHPDWKPHFEKNFPAFKKRGYVHDVQFKIRHKDGHYLDISFEGSVGYHPDGSFKQTYCVFQDITERKQVEQELEKERALLKAVIDNIPILLTRYDPAAKMLYLNKEFEKIVGWKTEEVQDIDMMEKVYPDPDYRKQAMEYMQKASTEWREFRVQSKSGKIIDSEWSNIRLEDGTQIGIGIDITGRKRAEEALLESERKLRNIFENSTNLFYSHTPEHILTYLSPQVKDILGYTQEEAMIKWTELVSDNPINEIGFKHTVKAIETGKHQPTYELELVKRNGEKIWVEVREAPVVKDGKTVSIVGALTDITERKQVEEVIKRSEERFHSIFHGSRDAIFISGMDAKFIEINQAASDLTGYSMEELKRMSIPDLHEMIERKAYKKYFNCIMSGEALMSIAKITRKDGKKVETEFSNRRIDISGMHYMHTVARDITKRKQAEEALKESEERYRALVEHSHDGILIVGKDYKFIYVNDRLCEILGYNRKEIIGHNFRDFLDEESRELVSERYIRRQRGENMPSRYEFNIVRKDGEKRHVEISSSVVKNSKGKINTIAQILDITERKQAEEELVKTRERLELAMDAGEHGFWDWNLDTNYVYFSPRYYTMLGYEPGELPMKLKTWVNLMHPDDQKTIVPEVKNYVKNAQAYEVEFRLKTKDGDWRWISGRGKSYKKDKDGISHRAVGVHVDITERKKAESLLQIERDKLTAIFDSMVDGIFIVNQDYDIEYVNPVLKKIFGSPEGKKCYEYFHNSDEPCTFCKNEEVFAGKTVRWEWTSPKNGRTYDLIDTPIINSDGSISKLEIFRDITERKQTEEALKDSENRLNIIFESAPDAYYLNDFEGIFIDGNKAAEELLGYPREELIGKNFVDAGIMSMDQAEKALNVLAKNINGESTGPDEYTLKRKDGSTVSVEILTHPVVIKGEDQVLGIARDITERKRAEEQIRNDLREKEVMLKEIHHRVKNNLQIMSSLLSLQASKADDERISMILNESKSRIQSMSIVHEMMYQNQDFAQINMKYYISKLIASMIRLYFFDIGRINIIEKCRNVRLDLNQAIPCGMIMNELVSNSIKHAFPDKRKGEIEIRLEKKSGKIHLSVRDDGIELPPDFKPSNAETLGMTIITDLTDQLNGKLKIVQDDGFKVFKVVF